MCELLGHGLVRVSSRKGQGAGLLLKVPGWSLELFTRGAAAAGEQGALFPAWNGRWFDPSNTGHRVREAFVDVGYGWVTSHLFRKTVATVLDEANLATTAIADQLGNPPKLVEQHYGKRRVANEAAGRALETMFDDDDE